MIEAILGGIVSGTIVAAVQHYFVWLEQQHFHIKKSVFDDAVTALSMYEADAMSIDLQAANHGAGGIRPLTKFQDATSLQIAKALALVPVYFSPEAALVYKIALASQLTQTNVPNSEYYARRDEAVRLLATELRPRHRFLIALFRGGHSPKATSPARAIDVETRSI
jgi:hypothetical protein